MLLRSSVFGIDNYKINLINRSTLKNVELLCILLVCPVVSNIQPRCNSFYKINVPLSKLY